MAAGPGQALLNQLQMPQSLTSDQQAQSDKRQSVPDEWALPQSFSNMPFFDPAVLSATSPSFPQRGELTILSFAYSENVHSAASPRLY